MSLYRVIVSDDPDQLRQAIQSFNSPGRVAGFVGSIDDPETRAAAEVMGREMFRVDEVEIVAPYA